MGGSGGGSYIGPAPGQQFPTTTGNITQTQSDEMDIEVSGRLANELRDVNARPVELMRERLDRIIEAIKKEIEGSIELRFGGSIQRHTYVDGLSDADLLVFLSDPQAADEPPSQLLEDFLDILRRKLSANVSLEKGDLAVTVTYPDGMEIQLLPALRAGEGLRIASYTTGDWSPIIHPEKFARKLTQANTELSHRLVPVIKLAKAALSNIHPLDLLTGYHVESLAIEAFRSYQGEMTTNAMLQHFFRLASELVRAPIKDSTGQSIHVDDYLGETASPQRRQASDVLDRIARRLDKANDRGSSSDWLGAIGLQV